MRHFDYLDAEDQERLFHRAPEPFGIGDDPGLLGVALGATLYCPATRPALAQDIIKRAAFGVMSVVVCLEDSIADDELRGAEINTIAQLRKLAVSETVRPMVFVRVRAVGQIPMLMGALAEHASVISGFVVPKFTAHNGRAYLDEVVRAGAAIGTRMLVMPVLESVEIGNVETRVETLLAARHLLDEYRPYVVAIRLGATDLSGAYGLRRAREMTVWDVRVVSDVMSAVVNIFGRVGPGGYVVAGPVWEYYSATERIFKPQLRESPFVRHAEPTMRAELIAKDLDGLIREVVLDRANGLTGKTVIHPTHVAAVHALSVVAREEWEDACDVLATNGAGGASASRLGNKMNESKPHTAWAHRTVTRAGVFGVSHEHVSFVDLLAAGLRS